MIEFATVVGFTDAEGLSEESRYVKTMYGPAGDVVEHQLIFLGI